jgi:type VI secretion system protein ImpA
MADLIDDIEPLLEGLGDDAPCGPDLEYDPDFQALERAGAGTPERQYGDKVYPAEPPEWREVHELARALAGRTRDVRVAVWLVRSSARLHGLQGAARALQLVQGLLDRHWPAVHPQLDATDNDDPTMRMNALAPLAAAEAVLGDLRAATLAPVRGALTLRELELGLGQDEPHGDEVQPSESGVLSALSALAQGDAQVAEAIQAAADAAQAVETLLESQVGAAAPNLSPLRRLLDMARRALERTQAEAGADAAAEGDGGWGGDDATAGGQGGQGGPGGVAVGGGGALRTRADVQREIDRLCEWFERNEPSHPAPLLLRRAQRLMGMSFMEIIQDMAAGGVDQVQTIAGTPPE